MYKKQKNSSKVFGHYRLANTNEKSHLYYYSKGYQKYIATDFSDEPYFTTLYQSDIANILN